MEKELKKLRIVFLGCTRFSLQLYNGIKDLDNIEIKAIFTSPKKFDISYDNKKINNINHVDFNSIGRRDKIPVYNVNSKKGTKLSDYYEIIQNINPDIILVLGWYFMVPLKIRKLSAFGAWGIHASLLPKYSGGAPLTWAIINGENKTGSTLFRLDSGVDDGDIINQIEIDIVKTDTINELYQRVSSESQKMLINTITNINSIKYIVQNSKTRTIYKQRNPEDGRIDLNWSKDKIFNFIRAQSYPYPGAFIETDDGYRMYFDSIRIEKKKNESKTEI